MGRVRHRCEACAGNFQLSTLNFQLDEDKTTMRNISNIEFVERDVLGEKILEIKISGNAFLHSMVRTMVGTLVKVGLGQRPVE